MSERKCLNCRHRILQDSSSYCGWSGNFLHYSEVFEGWCRHWAIIKPIEINLPKETKEGLEKLKQKLADEFGIPSYLLDYEEKPKKLKPIVWERNLEGLINGVFGEISQPETLYKYWLAQAKAGYPCAEENVRYFKDMMRIESEDTE